MEFHEVFLDIIVTQERRSSESSNITAECAVMWPQNNKAAQPWTHTLSPTPKTIQTRYYLVYLLNMATTETSSGNDHSNHIWEMAALSRTLSALDEWYHTWQRDCGSPACRKCWGVGARSAGSTKGIFVCSKVGEMEEKMLSNSNSCKDKRKLLKGEVGRPGKKQFPEQARF